MSAARVQETGDDPTFAAHAPGVIARTRGMTKRACETGGKRESLSLYRAPSGEDISEFATIRKAVRESGLRPDARAA